MRIYLLNALGIIAIILAIPFVLIGAVLYTLRDLTSKVSDTYEALCDVVGGWLFALADKLRGQK